MTRSRPIVAFGVAVLLVALIALVIVRPVRARARPQRVVEAPDTVERMNEEVDKQRGSGFELAHAFCMPNGKCFFIFRYD